MSSRVPGVFGAGDPDAQKCRTSAEDGRPSGRVAARSRLGTSAVTFDKSMLQVRESSVMSSNP